MVTYVHSIIGRKTRFNQIDISQLFQLFVTKCKLLVLATQHLNLLFFFQHSYIFLWGIHIYKFISIHTYIHTHTYVTLWHMSQKKLSLTLCCMSTKFHIDYSSLSKTKLIYKRLQACICKSCTHNKEMLRKNPV